jgi:molybdopterin-containing oxidoreductase family iron-sulfur binding subunit
MPELDRRDFLKVVGLSAGAAASAACREPVEKVIPYLVQPEEVIPGIPTYYASTCRECPVACSTRVKTREGRPIKVDVNPDDPISSAGLCVRGQASLNRTYDDLRFRSPMQRQGDRLVAISWEEATRLLVEKLGPAGAAGKVTFVGGLETGTLDELIDEFLAKLGSPDRVRFELYAHEALRTANSQVFGIDGVPQFDIGHSDLVISFGADFLETWLNTPQNQQGFAESRRGGKGYAIYVGPRLGLTGANTDEWLAPEPGTEVFVALALAHELAGGASSELRGLLGPFSPDEVAGLTGVPAERLREVAERIRNAEAPLALPPGNEVQGTNAASFAAAVQILNYVAGAINQTVRFGPDHNVGHLARFRDLKELAGRMHAGEIDVLLVHRANPVYDMPAAFGVAEAIKQVPFVVSFSSAPDETTSLAHLVLPDSTPYESWGDAEPVKGVRRLQQPTVRPLFDTMQTGDVLLEAGRQLGWQGGAASFYDRLVERWGGRTPFEAALARGGQGEPGPARTAGLAASVGRLRFEPAQLGGDGELALLAYPSLHFYDGRSARFGALQQIPDPVTKTTWGSYAELHPNTAAKLDVEHGDIVRIRTEAGELELPAFPHETIREDTVGVAVGQGHQPLAPDAELPFDGKDWNLLQSRRGVNVLDVIPGRLDPASGGLETFDQEGRGFAQTTTVAALAGTAPEPHDKPELEAHGYDPADDQATANSPYRWGLVIDTDACTGCNACISACDQENNIPVVGEDLIRVGRELSWIRMNRFVSHNGDAVEVKHLLMLCQHCGSAPCENVCPVIATYHTHQGLNAMIYNRCIGTRYCSNNCPYKVRRFNYLPFDFYVRGVEALRFNPDVTVRSKGVMEKCSMCVQRINYGVDQAVYEKRVVADGEVQTACEQACPSNAIVFGNYKDPASRVTKQRLDQRAYVALEHLNTRPGVTYLKSIRRSLTHDDGGGHGGGQHG